MVNYGIHLVSIYEYKRQFQIKPIIGRSIQFGAKNAAMISAKCLKGVLHIHMLMFMQTKLSTQIYIHAFSVVSYICYQKITFSYVPFMTNRFFFFVPSPR